MARQSFTWGAEPDNGDQFDVTSPLTLGVEFTASEAVPAIGTGFIVPGTLPTGPSPAYVSLWDSDDPVTPLAVGQFEWSDYTGMGGEYVEVDYDEPFDLAVGVEYRAAVQSFERFVNTLAWAFPFVDSGGILTGLGGVLRYPEYGFPNLAAPGGANYFVTPVLLVDDPVEPDGAGPPSVSSTKGWLTSDSTQLGPITSSTRRGP